VSFDPKCVQCRKGIPLMIRGYGPNGAADFVLHGHKEDGETERKIWRQLALHAKRSTRTSWRSAE
jgi:putative heme degradation protein